MTDTAVKTASWRGVTVRSAEANGRENNRVNTMMRAVKTRMANLDGD
jgi:hypothetical protein